VNTPAAEALRALPPRRKILQSASGFRTLPIQKDDDVVNKGQCVFSILQVPHSAGLDASVQDNAVFNQVAYQIQSKVFALFTCSHTFQAKS
jgi:trehalose-6-phosphate synthase